jgi:hypothetical protein
MFAPFPATLSFVSFPLYPTWPAVAAPQVAQHFPNARGVLITGGGHGAAYCFRTRARAEDPATNLAADGAAPGCGNGIDAAGGASGHSCCAVVPAFTVRWMRARLTSSAAGPRLAKLIAPYAVCHQQLQCRTV